MIKEGHQAVLIESNTELPCKKFITNYFPECKVIQKDMDHKFMVQYVQDNNVGLVFVDLAIDKENQLIDQLSKFQVCLILFETQQQYSKLNIKQTFHHLISDPLDLEKINSAILHITQHLNLQQLRQKISRLTHIITHLNNLTISISSKDAYEVIHIIDILRIEAARSYCIVHFFNSTKHIISKPLNALEKKLPKGMFLRIHSSHLVNVCAIHKFVKLDGHSVILENGQQLPVANRRKEQLLTFFNAI
ncbi:MAG: LytTR family transcriptional regulator [Saprospiraceae bacterium]|nr:LytTR family transcriptional regulator [Candidatus Defluviibacterium haderslevense]